jgi:hypothetical protein
MISLIQPLLKEKAMLINLKFIFSKRFITVFLTGVLAVLSTTTYADSRPATPNVYGKTIGNWGLAWWSWALGFPVATNPVLADGNVDCGARQTGDVWFLAGTFGTKAERTCTVKKGKALFFPILNAITFAPDFCKDVTSCRFDADITQTQGGKFEWACTVDGIPCIFKSPVVRAQSDPLRLNLKTGTIATEADGFGLDPGVRKIAISDGYWIMLDPLKPGVHTIHFTAATVGGLNLDVTYHLTVSTLDY